MHYSCRSLARMLQDKPLSCKTSIWLARFLKEMHFPGKILAKVVLFKKLNSPEIPISQTLFAFLLRIPFHYKIFTSKFQWAIHFLMKTFPFFASKSLIISSNSIKLSYLLCKKWGKNGQLLDNLIKRNKKSYIGRRYPKYPFWSSLQRYDNFSSSGLSSPALSTNALIQLTIGESFQTLSPLEPSPIVKERIKISSKSFSHLTTMPKILSPTANYGCWWTVFRFFSENLMQ